MGPAQASPPSPAALSRNLWLYSAYNAVIFTPFMLPIIVLFWQDNGLDLYDVFLLQALFAVGVVVLEVPTGLVADQIGKRTSLIASAAIHVGSMVIYALGHDFWVFLAAELGMSLAVSLGSGSGSALLYDTLDVQDRVHEYREREGRARALQMASFAISGVVGGLIGAWSFRAAMWASVIGPAIALVLSVGLVEARPPPVMKLREAAATYKRLVSDSARFVARHQLVRWNIALWAVLGGSSTWLLWLYQPYMTHVGLPIWSFGLAFASFQLVAAAASLRADRVARALGERRVAWLFAALQIGPLLGMAAFSGAWAWVFIWGHQVVRGMFRPVLSERILAYTWADKRSTVLSIAGLASRLFFALTALPIGLAAKHLSMANSLLVQAAALLGFLVLLLAARGLIPDKYDTVKDQPQPP